MTSQQPNEDIITSILTVRARYIASYEIPRYWRHIASYPYRDK